MDLWPSYVLTLITATMAWNVARATIYTVEGSDPISCCFPVLIRVQAPKWKLIDILYQCSSWQLLPLLHLFHSLPCNKNGTDVPLWPVLWGLFVQTLTSLIRNRCFIRTVYCHRKHTVRHNRFPWERSIVLCSILKVVGSPRFVALPIL